MSVKFCFASGCAPKPLSCGMEALSYPAAHMMGEETSPERANSKPFRLDEVGHLKYKTYTPEILRARVEVAMSSSDEMIDVWRARIICILGPLETVFCINFIASDPHQPHILQVMRMKDLEESAASCPIYCCDFSPLKFILPKAEPDQVFDLSQWEFSQEDSADELTRGVSLALECLKKRKI